MSDLSIFTLRDRESRDRWLKKNPLALVLVFFVLASAAMVQAQTPDNQNILFLYSSAADWDLTFNRDLIAELGPELANMVQPEYLNLSQSDAEQQRLIAESLRVKHQREEIDLVLGLFADTFEFLSHYQDVFAPSAKTIFVLPGATALKRIEAEANSATYVVPSLIEQAVRDTARTLPALLPNLKTLYVVGGSGITDSAYFDRYRKVLSNTDQSYTLEFIQGLPPEALIRRLSGSAPDSAILMSNYDLDQNGNSYATVAVTRHLQETLAVPVFGNTQVLINGGATGGSVVRIEDYARATAELIRSVLNGGNSQSPAPAITSFFFNGAALDRFGISRSSLPGGSTIIDDPPNLWRDFGLWIIVSSIVITLLLVLVTSLLIAIKQRRQAEAKLLESSKREALGSLAASIAHDFNNVLMAMMANAELATNKLRQPDAIKSHLHQILSAGSRAKGLVSEILMFSRNTATPSFKHLDLRALLAEACEQTQALMNGGCKVTLMLPDQTLTVSGNAGQLHQVFMNILTNAQHALENEGEIEVSAETVKAQDVPGPEHQKETSGDYIRVRISDTGAGMDAEVIRHIFEPFFTTRPTGGGTGLGLAIANKIVGAHQGSIDVSSRIGHGTTFSVYLKSAVASAESSVNQNLRGLLQQSTGTVLLVDDDELVLDVVNGILQGMGYEVIAFSRPVEALQAFEARPGKFDVLFTDLTMPEMDGICLARTIRKLRPNIPVILHSGYLDSAKKGEMENLIVLNKPASVEQIETALADSLRGTKNQHVEDPGHENNINEQGWPAPIQQ